MYNSFGGSIVLGLAARRPALFSSVIVHEPPLLSLVADEADTQPLLTRFQSAIDTVMARLVAGDLEVGSQLFVDHVAFGPGTWSTLPVEVRQSFVRHAMTWVDEQHDPHHDRLDVEGLSRLRCPTLLSTGENSFPWFPRIVEVLGAAIDHASVQYIPGAGHVPHVTHPDEYARMITAFIRGEWTKPMAG